MIHEIALPALSESVVEGTIGRWLKHPGEALAAWEPLVEVETDKLTTDIPSPVAGVLLECCVAAGTTVMAGTVIARIRLHAAPGAVPPAGAVAPAAPPHGMPPAGAAAPASRRPPISPVVARMAAEHRIDLAQIRGTGLDGRVSKRDVEGWLAARTVPAAAPLTPLRRAIAEHMLRSVRTAPHVTTVCEADMSTVVAHRAATAFGYTAYVAAAVVAALARFPRLNATFTDDGIIAHREIHLGIAVALPDGVLVPVIPRATADVAHLAPRIADLAGRARAGTLQAGETSGGTFTITNHGMLGSLWATPIIHQPQVAILGIGAVERRVVALPGDAIAIRPRCYLALSFDHRALDGALAGQFLAAVRSTLEAPWPA